ncbi:hypothetical protein B5F10_10405 [Anaerotruncus colihominis]|uniref:Uncharacterized protein n=1 Tax=Anaerotruncus colihominis TaxID=169435 RepID=A0A1Y4MKU3_9FIRM|nr:hypothetical protein [Anaerotruncus colihominis]OUP68739.1 hypothetical protein B5F11_12480 [Anaerotruncus colihominis]OUP73526.1 hypothetical protein B5F10_10405 [Anaerotruncus colihominis]
MSGTGFARVWGYFLNDAVEKYAKDLNDYFITLDEAKQGGEPAETEQAPERENDLFAVISKEQEREELLRTNEAIKTTELYRMTSVSNYGLWGKWYDSGNGWHRGIDICPGGNVHVFWPGVILERGRDANEVEYYVSIYSEDINATIIYMHLNISNEEIALLNGTAKKIIAAGEHVGIGTILGTQGKVMWYVVSMRDRAK